MVRIEWMHSAMLHNTLRLTRKFSVLQAIQVTSFRKLTQNQVKIRGRPKLSSFSWANIEYAGREGVKGCRTLLKNAVYGALRFLERVSKSINHSKYTFGREGGGDKTDYSLYAFANVDNSGRPQTRNRSFRGPACLVSIEAQKRNTKLCKQADRLTTSL